MDMHTSRPVTFRVSNQTNPILPLERYLPPYDSGVVTQWLAELGGSTRSWLLDPLGSNPLMPLEAARAGWRVLVCCNNPVLQLILRVLSRAHQKEDFQAALALLGSLRRGSDRLETIFQGMYETECASCGEKIQPEAYLWDRGENQPAARLYTCPRCGDSGERPPAALDIQRLARIGNTALHKARAFQRVSNGDAEAINSINEVLSAYLPRSLDFLFTSLNKLEGVSVPPDQRDLLHAILIELCSQGSSLWPWPVSKPRPRQISITARFRENNLWTALENIAVTWPARTGAVPVTTWPDLPPESGGICIYNGRLRALASSGFALPVQAAAAVIPRPNLALWKLSAVWSGWIWGKEAVTPLQGALEMRRYDWTWNANALRSSMHSLRQLVSENIPFFTIIPELLPGFLSSVYLGFGAAGFQVGDFSLCNETETAQISWSAADTPAESKKADVAKTFRDAAKDLLISTNQPQDLLTLQMAGLIELSRQNSLAVHDEVSSEMVPTIQNALGALTAASGELVNFNSQSQGVESGLWYLAGPPPVEPLPLLDRVEMAVVRALQKSPGLTFHDLEALVFPQFPGLETPPQAYLLACLESYAGKVQNPPEGWMVKTAEQPAARKKDLVEMEQILVATGKRFGLETRTGTPLIWMAADGRWLYRFYLCASSILSRFLFIPHVLEMPGKAILALPASRLDLLDRKFVRDPRLEKALEGWLLVKFRHLRRLAEIEDLSLDQWGSLLQQDPPLMSSAIQIPLL